MAVWQFKFSLVPTAGVQRIHGADAVVLQAYQISPDGPKFLDEEENLNYWADLADLQEIALASSEILPEMESWSGDARMFGNKESNKIEVWNDRVNCFIDMRFFSEEFLLRVVDMAKKFDCKFVISGSGVVIYPDLFKVIDQIKLSNAYKFCADPAGYLKSL